MPRAAPEPKPYHHRRLREAVIEAALAEIEAVGPTRLSMREIARRAGVSHAAPAHHFCDKRGIFTAIATSRACRSHTACPGARRLVAWGSKATN